MSCHFGDSGGCYDDRDVTRCWRAIMFDEFQPSPGRWIRRFEPTRASVEQSLRDNARFGGKNLPIVALVFGRSLAPD